MAAPLVLTATVTDDGLPAPRKGPRKPAKSPAVQFSAFSWIEKGSTSRFGHENFQDSWVRLASIDFHRP
jgi:hypothetical protein